MFEVLISKFQKSLTQVKEFFVGKKTSGIQGIPIFIEGEDPIENRMEIFISKDEAE